VHHFANRGRPGRDIILGQGIDQELQLIRRSQPRLIFSPITGRLISGERRMSQRFFSISSEPASTSCRAAPVRARRARERLGRSRPFPIAPPRPRGRRRTIFRKAHNCVGFQISQTLSSPYEVAVKASSPGSGSSSARPDAHARTRTEGSLILETPVPRRAWFRRQRCGALIRYLLEVAGAIHEPTDATRQDTWRFVRQRANEL
jgi:hypothetical protein